MPTQQLARGLGIHAWPLDRWLRVALQTVAPANSCAGAQSQPALFALGITCKHHITHRAMYNASLQQRALGDCTDYLTAYTKDVLSSLPGTKLSTEQGPHEYSNCADRQAE